MNRLIFRFILIISIACSMASVFAEDFVEVRGPVKPVIDGNMYTVSASRLSGGDIFKGFYYDIDNDIGTESLTLKITGNYFEGFPESPGVTYNTYATYKPFKFRDWGGYYAIGFLGESYFAGYAKSADVSSSLLYDKSEDKNSMNLEALLKVLKDDNKETIVKKGNPLKLEGGYQLLIRDIDIDGNKVYLELYKGDQLVNTSVVSPLGKGASVEDGTYLYLNDIGKIKNITVLAIHFKNAYHANDEDLATIDGIFQLSDFIRPIGVGNRYGAMKVSDFDPSQMKIKMVNRDWPIYLDKNTDTLLMEGIRIRVANPEYVVEGEPLRFYIYKKITEEGTHEIRGDTKETVIGAKYSYDAQDFPGFYYDIDDNLGTESLTLNINGNSLDWRTNYLDTIYRTYAKPTSFNLTKWGQYYAIGYMGERYFAGYIENVTNPAKDSYLCYRSDDRNIMQSGYVSKILIDSDEEKVLGIGSAIALDEGYQINIDDIDVNGDKITLSLSKNGKIVDGKIPVVVETKGLTAHSYCYRTRLGDTGSETGNVTIIALDIKNSFTDTKEVQRVAIDGIWQISDGSGVRKIHGKNGLMTDTDIQTTEGNQYIEMRNRDYRLALSEDRPPIHLMGDFYIKTADQEVTESNPLRFYIYRNATIKSMNKGLGSGSENSNPSNEYETSNNPMPRTDNPGPLEPPPKPAGFEGWIALGVILALIYLHRRCN